MRETDIQNSICEYLAVKKHFFFRLNNIPAFSKNPDGSIRMRRLPKYTPRGLPDIIVIKDGYFIGLEVKKPKTYQSKEQKEIEKQIKEAGGEYYVVRSIDKLIEIGL
jgi:hypothetical protein